MTQASHVSTKQFPSGAEWIRVDFHLHTKADKEFKYSGGENFYNSAYVDALEKAGIRLGVITNHNKFDFEEFKALRATARKKNIGLLPGVELSINEGQNGVHVLIVFSDAWLSGGDYISPFIGSMFPGKTTAEYQHENGKSDRNLLQLVETLEGLDKDFFLIFAHVEDPKGLWREVGCGRLADWKEDRYAALRRRTLGFQKVRSYNKLSDAGKPCRAKTKQALGYWYPAEVEGSDPKTIDEIGKGENHTYLKIGELSFEAVKFALFDYERRVRSALPEPRQAVLLKQVSFAGGALDGLTVPFSPSLNCLIGPRGNGKSAVIECVRHALGFREGADDNYKSGLVMRMLSPAGKVVVEAVDEFGRVDILVNNAAFQRTYGGIEEIPSEEWDYTFRTNIYAMFYLTKAAVPHMKPGSAIVNTTSIQSYQPSASLLAYATTKGAVTNFTKALAADLAEKGIRVNAVAPGPIWTPLIPSTMPAEQVKTFGQDTPLGRAGQPAELAPVYVLLASQAASYITGQIYGVTGGKPLV